MRETRFQTPLLRLSDLGAVNAANLGLLPSVELSSAEASQRYWEGAAPGPGLSSALTNWKPSPVRLESWLCLRGFRKAPRGSDMGHMVKESISGKDGSPGHPQGPFSNCKELAIQAGAHGPVRTKIPGAG